MEGPGKRAALVALMRHHWPYLLLLAAASVYLVATALRDYSGLGAGYDLGIYDQVVWNMAHGRFFQTTLVYETPGTYDHFEPVLALIAPIYWLAPDARVLLVIQSLALALGSAPIYLYARHRFGQLGIHAAWASLLPAAAYLLYPPLHAANLNDFHEVALLPPILGMALYSLLMGRRRALWLWLGCALLVKEDVAVTLLAFGIYIALLQPAGFRRRDGVILAVVAVAWGLLVLYALYPAMTRGMPYPFVGRRYAWLGESPQDAVRGLTLQPLAALGRIFQPAKLQFLYRLFAPLLFLPLLGWPIIGLALPVLGYLMLSDYPPQWSVSSYYNPPLLAFLFFATIEALAQIVLLTRRWGWRPRPTLAALLMVVFGAVAFNYASAAQGPEREFFVPAGETAFERARAAEQILAQIPPDAGVSAEWQLVPRLSHRERIYTLLARPMVPPDYRIIELRATNEGAPIYPYAAPDNWPPVYHEYQTVTTVAPFELSRLTRSVTLTPLTPVEPTPTPLELAAYAWLNEMTPGEPLRVRAGETARLMLAWRRTGQLDRRYVFFAHVLREGGPAADNGLADIVAQSGHEAGAGTYPTTLWDTWTSPRIVLDEQQLTMPQELAPGDYYVWAGAFDRETGDRVELGGSGKTLRLVTTLQVVP